MPKSIREKLGLHGEFPISDCVIFPGCKSHRGYGLLRYNGKLHHAHRVSYEVFKGSIPNKAYICHTCDNRPCVNPNHLFAASHDENMKDMVKKNRQKKGQQIAIAKLTPEQVVEIRKDPRSHRKIAFAFGVARATVGKIKRGETWGHV